MKFVRIFVGERFGDGLWSIQLDHEPESEFEKFFDLMNDVEWLHHFFDRNKADLHSGYFGKVTLGEAVSRTLDEAAEMEDALYDFSERGFNMGGAIKLTLDMKRVHLQQELRKLEQARQYLRSNGIEFPDDLNIYKHE